MTDEKDFLPRLGRIGNSGHGHFETQLKRLAAAARKGRPARHSKARLPGGSVIRQGRGKGASAMARHWAGARRRRVLVKVHIARAGPSGNAAFSKHVSYIRRDGTQRDGSGGKIYDRLDDQTDPAAFNERARDDRRQFRLIVSPEDAGRLEDLTKFTREFMAGVERDLGTRLDWVAANHHDTAHPHVHIVIRGGSTRDGELIIDRKYITHGLRHRAEECVTRELGQRRLREIASSRSVEAEKDAFTSLDRELAQSAAAGRVTLSDSSHRTGRFDRAVKARRLAHLKTLGLARHVSGSDWDLTPDWDETLKALGRRNDMINSLARKIGRRIDIENLAEFSLSHSESGEVTGRLSANIAGDELRNGRLIMVESLDGRQWTARITESDAAALPRLGGVVSLSATRSQPKPADRTIAMVAERNGGIYSDELHQAADPSGSPAFRLAHKRRLEALRRLGLVERHHDGSWTIPQDFESKAHAAGTGRSKISLSVRSWLPVEQLLERTAYTWLDSLDEDQIRALGPGFGAVVRAAHIARRLWVKDQGLDVRAKEALDRLEFKAALTSLASRTGTDGIELTGNGEFRGVYTRDLDLAQGRFAIIESERGVLLARVRAQYAEWSGRDVVVQRSGRTLQWRPAKERGLGR